MNHLVLFHPEIPQNTGNIMRTAMATESKLHIIGPLPFLLNDETIKRAGLDYVDHLRYQYYDSYEAFMKQNHQPKLYLITRYGNQLYTDIPCKDVVPDHYFMFGAESSGLPSDIMKAHVAHLYRIPMSPMARSLNLANTVALIIYDALRQQGFSGLATKEVLKGEDFLAKKINQ
jgi:tRNA (cytidine/uridine-2'-O-)-methyltransferase